jgi:hypothetical protein
MSWLCTVLDQPIKLDWPKYILSVLIHPRLYPRRKPYPWNFGYFCRNSSNAGEEEPRRE